ncbi:MAG: hypothetical protein LBU61_03935 [Coriobacteriales bacterium]|nr:hypothetical protein [Coriobacteriales bacterium]
MRTESNSTYSQTSKACIVVATHNTHKLPEIALALGLPEYELIDLGQAGID